MWYFSIVLQCVYIHAYVWTWYILKVYINEPIAIGYFYFKLSDCTDRLLLPVWPPLSTKKKKYA